MPKKNSLNQNLLTQKQEILILSVSQENNYKNFKIGSKIKFKLIKNHKIKEK